MERLKSRVILTLAVLVVVGLLSNRAIYLDEHIFLNIARNAQTNWMFPSDTPGVFFGIPKANFGDHTHPPVGEYYLALLTLLFGEFDEVPFRLAYSIFAIACVLAFYELARRFTAHPFLVSLLFLVTPAFLVYAPTLMMDIPMLAFLLIGIALYFSYVDGCSLCLPAASVFFILAVGTGYTALVPLGCMFLFLLAARRPWTELAAVAAAPVALVAWIAAMTIHYGDFSLPRTVQFFTSQNSAGHNILATLSFLGGVSIFPWLLPVKRKLIIGAVAIGLLASLLIPAPSMTYRLWYATLAGFGIVLLVSFADASRQLLQSAKNSGEAFFMLWIPMTLLFFILVADMINARYILLVIPPLYLLLFRHSSVGDLTYLLIPTALLSATVAYADYAFVGSYRDFVERQIQPLQRDGFNVWSGAETGLRFYLEENGAQTLSSEDVRPGPADLVVRSTGRYRYGLAGAVEVVLTPLKVFELNHGFPVRTFTDTARAGLHDSRLGFVPYAISRAPFDTVEIAEISPLPGAVYSPLGPVFKQTEPEIVFPMKFPANVTLEYDLEGTGAAEVTARGLQLRKMSRGDIVWRNFRLVPKQLTLQ